LPLGAGTEHETFGREIEEWTERNGALARLRPAPVPSPFPYVTNK